MKPPSYALMPMDQRLSMIHFILSAHGIILLIYNSVLTLAGSISTTPAP